MVFELWNIIMNRSQSWVNRIDLFEIVNFICMNVPESSITDVYFCPDKTVHIDVIYGGNDDFLVIDENGMVIIDNSFSTILQEV